ncbi:inositol 1,4,5-trisphosphate receptor-interacting protein isoform X1 [Silurus meridionalis]|uniref:inositol 1,4,5-trisphosphate receptor-interacting protein isoform X1 n=2 Tax=Silurus meridionalis TaxID=175797 RepID=UPI001EEA9492|nr:inositol 1,4,5-trisphosphate receptor-interacting protein isoform X1 [Silurus meridionalis]
MEEMLLRACVVVFSVLYIKDHTVYQEQEENIFIDMQEREYLLQKETAKLEQEMHQVTTGRPHSNQEVSQSHRRLKNEEGDDTDVQVENPPEHQMDVLHIQGKTVPHPDTMPSEVQRGVTEDVDLPPGNGVQPELVKAFENEIKNIHVEDISGHKKEPSHNDQRTETPNEAKTKAGQGNAHSSSFDQVEGMLNQMTSEDNPHRKVEKSTEDINEEQSTSSSQQSTENTYNWYLLKILSILSLIRFFKKYITKSSQSPGTAFPIKRKTTGRSTAMFSEICIPDHQVLNSFYDQCVKLPQSTRGRVCEFVEGFVDELLEAARKASNKESDMLIGDFIGVGSVYELWATGKTVVCDLYVPITAPRSHRFDVELWKEKDALLLGLGKIKMVKAVTTSNICPCMNGNPNDEDTLCLLHPQSETSKAGGNKAESSLCQENTYLSKKQVVTWFRTMIIKAWGEISHKYELELRFHSRVAPGALRVRFRSGQVILFNITPVVQVEASKVYLVSFLSTNQNISDIDWPISFASYENALLQYFSKTLPYKSCHIECLQILSFLHKQQTCLTGKCGLTNHHLKSTLLHLLMYNPTEWKHEQLMCRLTDMLAFLGQRLQEKELHHALVGNVLVPKDIGLPKEFLTAKPTNLFFPMVLDEEHYKRTVHHFQELVKNAPVLIQEYGSIKSSLQRK